MFLIQRVFSSFESHWNVYVFCLQTIWKRKFFPLAVVDVDVAAAEEEEEEEVDVELS